MYDDTSGDLSISEGENATLWCRATGHPPPRITWRREDGHHIILRKGLRDSIKRKYYKIITLLFLAFHHSVANTKNIYGYVKQYFSYSQVVYQIICTFRIKFNF